jgi:hypothetical protein
MFAPSTMHWQQGGRAVQARMETRFPYQPQVRFRLSTPHPTRFRVHVRVPSWTAAPMPIRVNGTTAATGKPGSYAVLSRSWKEGDTIAFALPMKFRLTAYRGAEQGDVERYALEYGAVLLALVDTAPPAQGQPEPQLAMRPGDLVKRLRPLADRPLHFAIEGDPGHEYMPYWEVADQVFSCYPAIGEPEARRAETVGADDLALASKGATASADSEYSQEPGCTAKAIDGIIATPGDFSNRWHSSLETPHPHWIQVKLPKPARIGRIVIRFADPAGHPTTFQGLAPVGGRERILFEVKDCYDWRRYEARVAPVTTDTFRLVIRASANPAYPNAAQISEIELYP